MTAFNKETFSLCRSAPPTSTNDDGAGQPARLRLDAFMIADSGAILRYDRTRSWTVVVMLDSCARISAG
jgi:hypothetical protein